MARLSVTRRPKGPLAGAGNPARKFGKPLRMHDPAERDPGTGRKPRAKAASQPAGYRLRHASKIPDVWARAGGGGRSGFGNL